MSLLDQPDSPQSPTTGGAFEGESAWVADLKASLGRVLVGQEDLVHGLLLGLLSGGHILLEGVPGIAKTLAASSLAGAIHASFARVQFTPDLLPSDLVGTEIYDHQKGEFTTRRGPIFANFVLADEINRAPAKVQSALLEAMQERQVSIGGQTFPLPRPFLVLATQNPIEQEGTYQMPEAQLDRFYLKLLVDYPDAEEELEVMERMARTGDVPVPEPVVELDAILRARACVDRVRMEDRLKQYIVALVRATRDPGAHGLGELRGRILYGASPRASIVLAVCARANAFLSGRDFATPGDVKAIAHDVLRHRVLASYEAEAEGITSDQIVSRFLETIPVP